MMQAGDRKQGINAGLKLLIDIYIYIYIYSNICFILVLFIMLMYEAIRIFVKIH